MIKVAAAVVAILLLFLQYSTADPHPHPHPGLSPFHLVVSRGLGRKGATSTPRDSADLPRSILGCSFDAHFKRFRVGGNRSDQVLKSGWVETGSEPGLLVPVAPILVKNRCPIKKSRPWKDRHQQSWVKGGGGG